MINSNKAHRKSIRLTVLVILLAIVSLAVPVMADIVGTPGNVGGASNSNPAKATLWFASQQDIIGYRFSVYSENGIKKGHAITILDTDGHTENTKGMYCYLYYNPATEQWELPDKLALSAAEKESKNQNGKKTYDADLVFGKYTKNTDGTYTMKYYDGNEPKSYVGNFTNLANGQVYADNNDEFKEKFDWGGNEGLVPDMTNFTYKTTQFFSKDKDGKATGWLQDGDKANVYKVKQLCGVPYSAEADFIFVEPIVHGTVDKKNYALTVTEWAYFQCNAMRSYYGSDSDGWTKPANTTKGESSDWYGYLAPWFSSKFPASLYTTSEELDQHLAKGKITSEQANMWGMCDPIPSEWAITDNNYECIYASGDGYNGYTGKKNGQTYRYNTSKTVVQNMMGVGVYYEKLDEELIPITVETTKDNKQTVPFDNNKVITIVRDENGNEISRNTNVQNVSDVTTASKTYLVPPKSTVQVYTYSSLDTLSGAPSLFTTVTDIQSAQTITIPYYTLTLTGEKGISSTTNKTTQRATPDLNARVYIQNTTVPINCTTNSGYQFRRWTTIWGNSASDSSSQNTSVYLTKATKLSAQTMVSTELSVDVYVDDKKASSGKQYYVEIDGVAQATTTAQHTSYSAYRGSTVKVYAASDSANAADRALHLIGSYTIGEEQATSNIRLYYNTLTVTYDNTTIKSATGGGVYLTGWSNDSNVVSCSAKSNTILEENGGIIVNADTGNKPCDFGIDIKDITGDCIISFEASGLEEGQTIIWRAMPTVSLHNVPIHNGINFVHLDGFEPHFLISNEGSTQDNRNGSLVLTNFHVMRGTTQANCVTQAQITATPKDDTSVALDNIATLALYLDDAPWRNQTVKFGNHIASYDTGKECYIATIPGGTYTIYVNGDNVGRMAQYSYATTTYSFTNWTGDYFSNDAQNTFTITGKTLVHANGQASERRYDDTPSVKKNFYTLTTIPGEGILSVLQNGEESPLTISEVYLAGTTVNVGEKTAAKHNFTGWTLNAGVSDDISSLSSTTPVVTMNHKTTITANAINGTGMVPTPPTELTGTESRNVTLKVIAGDNIASVQIGSRTAGTSDVITCKQTRTWDRTLINVLNANGVSLGLPGTTVSASLLVAPYTSVYSDKIYSDWTTCMPHTISAIPAAQNSTSPVNVTITKDGAAWGDKKVYLSTSNTVNTKTATATSRSNGKATFATVKAGTYYVWTDMGLTDVAAITVRQYSTCSFMKWVVNEGDKPANVNNASTSVTHTKNTTLTAIGKTTEADPINVTVAYKTLPAFPALSNETKSIALDVIAGKYITSVTPASTKTCTQSRTRTYTIYYTTSARNVPLGIPGDIVLASAYTTTYPGSITYGAWTSESHKDTISATVKKDILTNTVNIRVQLDSAGYSGRNVVLKSMTDAGGTISNPVYSNGVYTFTNVSAGTNPNGYAEYEVWIDGTKQSATVKVYPAETYKFDKWTVNSGNAPASLISASTSVSHTVNTKLTANATLTTHDASALTINYYTLTVKTRVDNVVSEPFSGDKVKINGDPSSESSTKVILQEGDTYVIEVKEHKDFDDYITYKTGTITETVTEYVDYYTLTLTTRLNEVVTDKLSNDQTIPFGSLTIGNSSYDCIEGKTSIVICEGCTYSANGLKTSSDTSRSVYTKDTVSKTTNVIIDYYTVDLKAGHYVSNVGSTANSKTVSGATTTMAVQKGQNVTIAATTDTGSITINGQSYQKSKFIAWYSIAGGNRSTQFSTSKSYTINGIDRAYTLIADAQVPYTANYYAQSKTGAYALYDYDVQYTSSSFLGTAIGSQFPAVTMSATVQPQSDITSRLTAYFKAKETKTAYKTGSVGTTLTVNGCVSVGIDVLSDGKAHVDYYFDRGEVKITYVLNGGTYGGSTANVTRTYPVGTTITLIDPTAPAGKTFGGWYLNQNGDIFSGCIGVGNSSYLLMKDTTVYACWYSSNDIGITANTIYGTIRTGGSNQFMSSATVINHSRRDIVPGDHVDAIVTVYKGSTVLNKYTVSNICVPALKTNLLSLAIPCGSWSTSATYSVEWKLDFSRSTVSDEKTVNNKSTIVNIRPDVAAAFSNTERPTYSLDRDPAYNAKASHANTSVNTYKWQVWTYKNGSFVLNTYTDKADVTIIMKPENENGLRSYTVGVDNLHNYRTRSGYGFSIHSIFSDLSLTPQRSNIHISSTVGQLNVKMLYPEFNYSDKDGKYTAISSVRSGDNYVLTMPLYSDYVSNDVNDKYAHYTPMWMPDGAYRPLTVISGLWSPIGEVTATVLQGELTTKTLMDRYGVYTNTYTIEGSLYDDLYVN